MLVFCIDPSPGRGRASEALKLNWRWYTLTLDAECNYVNPSPLLVLSKTSTLQDTKMYCNVEVGIEHVQRWFFPKTSKLLRRWYHVTPNVAFWVEATHPVAYCCCGLVDIVRLKSRWGDIRKFEIEVAGIYKHSWKNGNDENTATEYFYKRRCVYI